MSNSDDPSKYCPKRKMEVAPCQLCDFFKPKKKKYEVCCKNCCYFGKGPREPQSPEDAVQDSQCK